MSDVETDKNELAELRKALTPKELLFSECYLGEAHLNGTRAAKMAEYAGNANALGSVAYKNLRKPHIRAYIAAKLAEVMSANEVLYRLGKIARSSIDDVLADENAVWFDQKKARNNGSIHLLKKIKAKRIVKQKKTEIAESMRSYLDQDEIEDLESDTEILHEEIEFEMMDAQSALVTLGKFHKLFTDKVDLSGNVETANVSIYIPDNGRDQK